MLSAFRIAAGNGDLLRKSRVTDKSVPYGGDCSGAINTNEEDGANPELVIYKKR